MLSLKTFGKTDSLLALFGLSFVVFGWFALSLALGGLFSFSFVIIGAALIGIIALIILFRLFFHASDDLRFACIIILIYAVLVGYFSEPTLFSGRDQGSIAEAAFRLAENGQLAFSLPASDAFFEIYGSGTALNFPGFAYTDAGDIITQFPLGYTAWLAAFITLFGTAGIIAANALLLFLFLFLFFGLLRLFVRPFYALSGTALAACSFLPVWFSKMTVTENMGVFLFVFLSFSLVLFLREGKFLSYTATVSTAGLFAFTRIEGFAFLGITLGILLFSRHTRDIWKTYPFKSIILPGIIFVFFFLRDFFLNLPYYKMAGKGLMKLSFSGGLIPETALQGSTGIGSVFFLYGLLAVFIVGVFGWFIFIRKKNFLCFIPALIAFPTFFYLFSPNITPDHPWMLRRFLFSVFPALVFSATVGVALLSSGDTTSKQGPAKKQLFFSGVIFLGLLFFQYPAWSEYFTFAENKELVAQIDTFSRKFTEQDLILVDRLATGDGFAMLSGPAQYLFRKNTAYFFNPYDLERLDTSRFENTYFLVPEEDFSRYAAVFGERLTLESSVTFSLERLEPLSLRTDAIRLPQKTVVTTRNLLFRIH